MIHHVRAGGASGATTPDLPGILELAGQVPADFTVYVQFDDEVHLTQEVFSLDDDYGVYRVRCGDADVDLEYDERPTWIRVLRDAFATSSYTPEHPLENELEGRLLEAEYAAASKALMLFEAEITPRRQALQAAKSAALKEYTLWQAKQQALPVKAPPTLTDTLTNIFNQ